MSSSSSESVNRPRPNKTSSNSSSNSSVRVTMDIPTEAAEQLLKLLQNTNNQNEHSLAELGISSLQVQGTPAVKFKLPTPDPNRLSGSSSKTPSSSHPKSRDRPSTSTSISMAAAASLGSSRLAYNSTDNLSYSVKEMQNRLLQLGALNRKIASAGNATTSLHRNAVTTSSVFEGTKKLSSSPLLVNLLRQESDGLLSESDLAAAASATSSGDRSKKVPRSNDRTVKDRNGGSGSLVFEKRSHGDLNRINNSMYKVKPSSSHVSTSSEKALLLNNHLDSDKSVRLKLRLPIDNKNNTDDSERHNGGSNTDRKIPKLILSVKDRTIREAKLRIADEQKKKKLQISTGPPNPLTSTTTTTPSPFLGGSNETTSTFQLSTKLSSETILEKVQQTSTLSIKGKQNADDESKAVKYSSEKLDPSKCKPESSSSLQPPQPNGENHNVEPKIKLEPKSSSTTELSSSSNTGSSSVNKLGSNNGPSSSDNNGSHEPNLKEEKDIVVKKEEPNPTEAESTENNKPKQQQQQIKEEPPSTNSSLTTSHAVCNGILPPNFPSSITVTPSSKMVPVKLVTVSGEGNVRLVRLSPVNKSKSDQQSKGSEQEESLKTSVNKSSPPPSFSTSSVTKTATTSLSSTTTVVPSSTSTSSIMSVLKKDSLSATAAAASSSASTTTLAVSDQLANPLSITKPRGLEITRLHNGTHSSKQNSSESNSPPSPDSRRSPNNVVNEDPFKNLKAAQQAVLNDVAAVNKAKTIRLHKQLESAGLNCIMSKAKIESAKNTNNLSSSSFVQDLESKPRTGSDLNKESSSSTETHTNAMKLNNSVPGSDSELVAKQSARQLAQMRLSLARQQQQQKLAANRPQLKRKIAASLEVVKTTSETLVESSADAAAAAAAAASNETLNQSATAEGVETRVSTRSTKLVDNFAKRRKT